jgi:hypothetical protein
VRKGKIIGEVPKGSKLYMINGKMYVLSPESKPKVIVNDKIEDVEFDVKQKGKPLTIKSLRIFSDKLAKKMKK